MTEEILKVKNEITLYDKSKGYTVINIFFEDEWSKPEKMKERGVKNIPVAFLAKSIECMANCDAVIFADGWTSARGCCIESEIANRYGLEILYHPPTYANEV